MLNSKSVDAVEVDVQTLGILGAKTPISKVLDKDIGLRLESNHVLLLGQEVDGIKMLEIHEVSNESWRNPSGDYKLLHRVPVVRGVDTILLDHSFLCPPTLVTARIINLEAK